MPKLLLYDEQHKGHRVLRLIRKDSRKTIQYACQVFLTETESSVIEDARALLMTMANKLLSYHKHWVFQTISISVPLKENK